MRRPPTRSPIRGPVLWGIGVAGVVAVLIPVASHQLGPTTSFVPAMLAVVACFDLMSLYLLVADFLDTGESRMLFMSVAYLWSMVLMGGYALAFPGAVSLKPPLGGVPSTAPWLYVGWHTGFPVLLALSWGPWPRRAQQVIAGGRRNVVAALVVGGAALTSATLVALCVVFDAHLPVLIVGSNTSAMTRLTGPIAVPLVTAGLVLSWWGLRYRRGPERWALTAVLICLSDLVLTYESGHRYSLGWYVGRTLTMAGAGVVLFAMFRSFRALRAEAVLSASTDALTGLPNRRTLAAKLAREVSRAERTGAALSILLLDLDGFKALNDSLGHAAGDAALCNVATAWASRLRPNDLLARSGGDEFVVVAPDTTRTQALRLAVRLRASTPPVTGVSIGTAGWSPGEGMEHLLARADRAMYSVKARKHAA